MSLAATRLGQSNDGVARLQPKPAYVQRLLYETGASFTERVLELRLQKTRTMLAGATHARARISDAFAST